jgi:capsular polysaccharide biosynthesis protein
MIFARVFIPIFLLVFISSIVVTFILPESYASTAHVAVKTDPPSACKVISSEDVLKPVIDALNLNLVWGKKYNSGNPLNQAETLKLLKSRLEVIPDRGAGVVDIRMFSEDKIEAAQIANAVADAYSSRLLSATNAAVGAQILERATPGQTPVRPNKPLNIFIGAVAGILLGSIAGGIVAGLGSLRNRITGQV